ncbi:hypothetical protein D3C76_1497200 [compost metagenome]
MVAGGLAYHLKIMVADCIDDRVGDPIFLCFGKRLVHRFDALLDNGVIDQANLPRVCCWSTRTMLPSVMGVSGWSRILDSLSSVSPTNKWPL